MISAKGGESDVIAALRCGADDYLTKPYRSAELLERVKAHMRVSDGQGRNPQVTYRYKRTLASLTGALSR